MYVHHYFFAISHENKKVVLDYWTIDLIKVTQVETLTEV